MGKLAILPWGDRSPLRSDKAIAGLAAMFRAEDDGTMTARWPHDGGRMTAR